MALRIPVKTPQERLPGSLGAPRVGPNAGSEVAEAFGRAGRMMAQRGLEMQTERNEAKARSVFNAFRSTARDKYNAQLQRRGGDATGVMDEYGTWYNEEAAKIGGELENQEQQSMFERLYTPHREQDLDSLSRHESIQHDKFKKSNLEGTLDRLQSDVRMDPYSIGRMKLADAEIEATYKTTYPGMDNSADIAKAKAANRVAAIQEMLDPDVGNPGMAKHMLKEWKDELGGAYHKLKAKVDKANIKVQGQAMADQIMGKHDSYQDQLKAARKVKNADVRDDTVKRVKARYEEAQEIEKEQTEQRRDLKTKQVMEIWRSKGNREKALDLIENEDDRKAIGPLVKSLYGEKQQTDYFVYTTAQDKIDQAVEDDKPLTDESIIREFGPSVKPTHLESLLKYNKSSQKQKVKQSITAQKNRIKEMYNRGDFGKTTGKRKGKAARIKADILVGLNEWIEDNPGKDPAEYVSSKLDLIAAEEMAKELSVFWENLVPGEQEDQRLKAIASGDRDLDLAAELIKSKGYNPEDFSPEELEQVANTTEFNKYKTELLSK